MKSADLGGSEAPSAVGLDRTTNFVASGFILAGGRSSRMGSDKALALVHGRPLIENALNLFAAIGIPARIAGSRSILTAYAEVVPDTWTEVGPMGGIHAALAATTSPLNLFLPVDMPLVPASLLRCLLERAQLTGAPITAVRLNGRLEPFPVLLHRDILPRITQRLIDGKTAPHQAWQTIPAELNSTLDAPSIESLIQCGQCAHRAGLPPHYWFQSANTPADLACANQLVQKNS